MRLVVISHQSLDDLSRVVHEVHIAPHRAAAACCMLPVPGCCGQTRRAPDMTSLPTVGSVECSASERSARRRRWARCSRSRQMVGHGQRSSVRSSTATQHIQHSPSLQMQRSMQRRKEQARDNKRALLESTDWANVACGCVLPSSAVPAYAASACPVPMQSEQQSRLLRWSLRLSRSIQNLLNLPHTFCCGSGKLTRVVAIKDRNELHINFQLPPLTMHNSAFQALRADRPTV